MKRSQRAAIVLVLLAALTSVAWRPAAARFAMPDVPTVFITKTGEKYHLESCRHLRKSREELPLDEARERGYEACGICKPPQ